MASTLELLGGVLRYFPNTIMITLLVGGIALGRIAWILIGLGAIILSAAVLTLQYLFEKGLGMGPMPGAGVLDACSLIPAATGASYSTLPSLWMALTTYFVGYIFINALYIYRATPLRRSKEALPVQQRKGLGMISILASVILFVFLIVPRARTTCETWGGAILGIAAGGGFAYGWWKVLDACGSDVFPDIHGVLTALKPGKLHNAPRACIPKDATG